MLLSEKVFVRKNKYKEEVVIYEAIETRGYLYRIH